MNLEAGLTGGIGAGKTTVGRIFAGLGCFVVDADSIVTDLYRPGAAGYNAILEHYGPGILDREGQVDRKRLARIAFSSEREAALLNGLIHPLVQAQEDTIIENESKRFPDEDRIVIVEATLLLEAGGKERYDRIIVVDASPEVQLRRAVERGMKKRDVERRMNHQMPREKRLAEADYVIRNDGTMEALEAETRNVYARLEADLRSKKQRKGGSPDGEI